MRDRGKAIDAFNGGDDNFSVPMEFPCRKHPSSSSSGGICAFCLRDKLARLVCPQCGEQRLPNCSCSVSAAARTERFELLRRSSSTRVGDLNPGGGLRRIRNLFRKKKEEKVERFDRFEVGGGELGVSRSRSLCSYRGGNNGGLPFYDADDGGAIHSAARASSVSGGFVMESAKRSCFSESEARMSNFDYTVREGYEFYNGEDPKFIDLKLDLSSSSSSEIRTEHSVFRNEGYGGFNGGSSCRLSVSENELKKCRKSRKGWRWLFKASSNLGKERD